MLTFAMPFNFSGSISAPAVHITGFLKGRSQIRWRTVQEIFTDHAGLTLNCTPIRLGKGTTLISHPDFTAYIKKSTKDRAEATSNPNLLFRVDISGSTDHAQPPKRGPKGPRKPLQLLDANMENIVDELQASRSGRGVSSPSSCARDENAAPPPTPSAAPMLASEPSVIPRRHALLPTLYPPPPHSAADTLRPRSN